MLARISLACMQDGSLREVLQMLSSCHSESSWTSWGRMRSYRLVIARKQGDNAPCFLVVWGVEDRWIPVETAGRLRDRLNARELVLIEGAGHLVMYDQPGRLGVELGWWLNEVRG